MRVIETTAHVGPDGMLLLKVPTGQRDEDLKITLVLESVASQANRLEPDRWASVRAALEASGISVPPPGLENAGPVRPVELPGPTASEMLVGDRR